MQGSIQTIEISPVNVDDKLGKQLEAKAQSVHNPEKGEPGRSISSKSLGQIAKARGQRKPLETIESSKRDVEHGMPLKKGELGMVLRLA